MSDQPEAKRRKILIEDLEKMLGDLKKKSEVDLKSIKDKVASSHKAVFLLGMFVWNVYGEKVEHYEYPAVFTDLELALAWHKWTGSCAICGHLSPSQAILAGNPKNVIIERFENVDPPVPSRGDMHKATDCPWLLREG